MTNSHKWSQGEEREFLEPRRRRQREKRAHQSRGKCERVGLSARRTLVGAGWGLLPPQGVESADRGAEPQEQQQPQGKPRTPLSNHPGVLIV